MGRRGNLGKKKPILYHNIIDIIIACVRDGLTLDVIKNTILDVYYHIDDVYHKSYDMHYYMSKDRELFDLMKKMKSVTIKGKKNIKLPQNMKILDRYLPIIKS